MKFVKITSIKSAGKQHVYDLSMAENEDPSFIANGFVVHNSYASAESAYSSFLETVSAYRTHLTNNIFYKKIFPLLAVANGMIKDNTKKSSTDSVVDFLFNTANRQNLKQPTLHWHKDLTARTEDNTMDMLEKVKDVTGMNVPLKTWLAAAGVDKDTLVRDHREDAELRTALGMDGGGNDLEDESLAASLMPASLRAGHRKRKSILSRDFNTDGELYTTSPTGKKHHVINSDAKQKDIHHRIAKIAARAESDPEYREELKRRNIEKTGSATLSTPFF
jgi:hypothetical protein